MQNFAIITGKVSDHVFKNAPSGTVFFDHSSYDRPEDIPHILLDGKRRNVWYISFEKDSSCIEINLAPSEYGILAITITIFGDFWEYTNRVADPDFRDENGYYRHLQEIGLWELLCDTYYEVADADDPDFDEIIASADWEKNTADLREIDSLSEQRDAIEERLKDLYLGQLKRLVPEGKEVVIWNGDHDSVYAPFIIEDNATSAPYPDRWLEFPRSLRNRDGNLEVAILRQGAEEDPRDPLSFRRNARYAPLVRCREYEIQSLESIYNRIFSMKFGANADDMRYILHDLDK